MLFEKIKFNIGRTDESRQINLFSFPIVKYLKSKKNKHDYLLFPCINKEHDAKNKEIFYLKVNRNESYSIRCLQHWIDIINEYRADFYIICDNQDLKQRILKQVRFRDKNIKFLKSIKNNKTKKIVSNIATSLWKNATFAHLTPFYHSRINNITKFWNIDADDTMFALYADKVAQIMKEISSYANNNNLNAFSLDMHTSRTHGKHWSFGITYTQNNIDWFQIFMNNKDTSWRKAYLQYDYNFNLDWFFTYLRDNNLAQNETFYIDNLLFIHFGDFLYNTIGSGASIYSKKKIKYPILYEIFGAETLGLIDINKNIIKFNNDLSLNDCQKFMRKYQTYIEVPSLPRDNMWLSS